METKFDFGWLYRSRTAVVAREKDPVRLTSRDLSKCRNKARYLIPTATHDGCTAHYIMYILLLHKSLNSCLLDVLLAFAII